ncbi:leucine-rich repeat domain-containing protein, partial [Akkermansiaceae bacterium]|nr:leucine-rich repeat domain-containing protein [Akkermansiaceae bacterium]
SGAFTFVADGAAAIITRGNKASFGDISTEWNGLTLNCLDGALTWAKTGGEIAIVNCNEAATGELVIPDTIEGNPVTSIGDDAFRDCASLTSITIPDSVTSIGEEAFRDCTSLTNMIIPDGVTSIERVAFFNCASLTSITIGNGVTSIGQSAFGKCSSLTSITIPNSVTSIGIYAFDRCNSLTSITIPDSVVSIGSYAFVTCDNLTNITIGNGVTSIGDYAFFECPTLTSITFRGAAPTVGGNAFYGVADGAVALLTSENLGSYKWNGLTLTDADQSDAIAQLEAQLAQMTVERDAAITQRDARPTQTAYDMVVTERDARPTIEDVKDARLGSVMLQSDVANQSVKIRFSIEETDDFRNWTKRDEINEITVPLEVGKRFYRFALEDE